MPVIKLFSSLRILQRPENLLPWAKEVYDEILRLRHELDVTFANLPTGGGPTVGFGSRFPEIPTSLGSNQWQFTGAPYEVYINGQKLRYIGPSPDYTVLGNTIALAWTLGVDDKIEGFTGTSRMPEIPASLGSNQWQFSGVPYEVYVNGQKLRYLGGSPDYTQVGNVITLAWTLGVDDRIEGFTGASRIPKIPVDLGGNQWQFPGIPYEVYVNGQKLRYIGPSPDYTVMGNTITLAWTLGVGDNIEGYDA